MTRLSARERAKAEHEVRLVSADERVESLRAIKALQHNYAQYAQFGLWDAIGALFIVSGAFSLICLPLLYRIGLWAALCLGGAFVCMYASLVSEEARRLGDPGRSATFG